MPIQCFFGYGAEQLQLLYITRGYIMAQLMDSAESKQQLNDLKGRMLALKEHL